LPKTQGQAFSFNNKVQNSNTATTLQIGNEVPKKIKIKIKVFHEVLKK
jgi:hypothetical protein